MSTGARHSCALSSFNLDRILCWGQDVNINHDLGKRRDNINDYAQQSQ